MLIAVFITEMVILFKHFIIIIIIIIMIIMIMTIIIIIIIIIFIIIITEKPNGTARCIKSSYDVLQRWLTVHLDVLAF